MAKPVISVNVCGRAADVQIVTVGASAVGKTSLANQLVNVGGAAD